MVLAPRRNHIARDVRLWVEAQDESYSTPVLDPSPEEIKERCRQVREERQKRMRSSDGEAIAQRWALRVRVPKVYRMRSPRASH